MNHPPQELAKLKGWMTLFLYLLAMTGSVVAPALLVSLATPVLAQTESDRKAEAERRFQSRNSWARLTATKVGNPQIGHGFGFTGAVFNFLVSTQGLLT